MTRRRLLLFLVIGAIAVANAGARYAGLTDLVGDDSYSVAVELEDSGGLYEAAEVTYRGVRIGSVERVEFRRDGVTAHLRIDEDMRVPRDLVAEVHNRSAVGEQYVDLVPRSADGPMLADGDVVRPADTTTPVAEEDLLLSIDRLVTSIDTGDLSTVVTELGTALGGRGEDVGRIIDNAGVLLDAGQASLPDLTTLLASGEVVLQTQADLTPAIAATLSSLAVVTDVVARDDAAVRQILTSGADAGAALDGLAADLTPVLPSLLADVAGLATVTSDRLTSLEQTLVVAPLALASGVTPGRDNKSHFALAMAQAPDVCREGFIPASEWRSPNDFSAAEVPEGIGCAEGLPATPRGGTQLVRGNDPSRFTTPLNRTTVDRSGPPLLSLLLDTV
ncbi:MAG: MlaD family protein [Aeromicrobium sp.]|uniref:MCE family protein n=1 Tax=Aeromicrobium sp. TaxID=1871063 RepID=UPI0025BFD2CA|nr:MlaD family protein [Aeromicrobium sp.]MCK5892092.1 MCE family protein [Aeromicrobium sp.]MDF1704249.1 MlaD family protein [Aeromicrobium sp.]